MLNHADFQRPLQRTWVSIVCSIRVYIDGVFVKRYGKKILGCNIDFYFDFYDYHLRHRKEKKKVYSSGFVFGRAHTLYL